MHVYLNLDEEKEKYKMQINDDISFFFGEDF